jgi:transposase
MSLQEQEAVLAQVEEAGWGKRKLLAQLHVPRSTYYRWRSQQRQGKLGSSSQNPKIPWNRLSSQEEAVVLANARKYPDLSSRPLAAWITDHQGFSVSEATVYRILRRAGLVKSPELKLLAGKEYHRKSTGPHQLWAPDASYFRVVGWGYYYLVTVMDDYSRFVLAWKLQTDMTRIPSSK